MNIPFKNPLVVGYKGEVGSFLLNCLLKVMPKALNVWCYDINETPIEREYRIKLADYIFLCVPLQETLPWLIQYKYLLKNKTIIEQASIKGPIYADKDLEGLKIVPMHLLFRPSATPNYADRRCAFVDRWKNYDLVDAILEMTNSEVVFYCSVDEHDRVMAAHQALVHRTLLTLGNYIKQFGHPSTYVSRKVIELVKRIEEGNKDLYSAIQDNKELPEILVEFKKELDGFKMEKFFG